MKTNVEAAAETIEARKARWRKFIEPDAAAGFLFHINYADAEFPEPERVLPWPDKVEERIEWSWSRYRSRCARACLVDDDRLPSLGIGTGTEIFAEALGCKVARPENVNPFALACVNSSSEADKIRVPELSASSLAYLFDMADELKRRGGPEALVKPVDIQSPMDIAALVWEKSALFMAMIDAPEAVKELAEKARQLLCAFMDEWFSRYSTEYVAHYPDYLMNGGLTLSEDEIGSVSEDMFEEFFRDKLVALSEHYGGLGIHCCADARHQWANLAALPGLRVLNLCRPPTRSGEEYTKPAYEFFGESIVHCHHGWLPDVSPAELPAQYPPNRRIVLEFEAGGREEAICMAGELREALAG